MKKKDIIIDGDKFQKEYKHQIRKELISDLIQGIILLIISCAGLFFGSKLLLKLVIYVFPLLIFIYATNIFTIGIKTLKISKKQGISLLIEAIAFALFAIYIFINPINTLGMILVIIGSVIIANAIMKMLIFTNYLPIGSFIFGGILIFFADGLINLFYTIVMIALLFYGISKISKFIYSIKNK